MDGNAFYLPDDDAFRATEHTRGPWSDEHQHAGPPSALLARAMEAVAARLGTPTPMRFTLELLRPIPIATLTVRAEAAPEGKSVRRVHASLSVDGVDVARAVGLFVAARSVDAEVRSALPPLPSPATGLAETFPFFRSAVGYHTSMDVRFVRGRVGEPRVAAWLRMRMPLLPGEVPSGAQRVLIAADSGNGITAALDVRKYSFVNADLTVCLHRIPTGEWVGLDAEMRVEPSGVGLAETCIHDEAGPIGRGAQCLIVRNVIA